MKKLLIVCLLSFGVASCQTTPSPPITKEIFRVVDVPTTLFNCPQIKKADFPNLQTATNEEVSAFITKLYKYNRICGYSVDQIKSYIAKARARLKALDS